MPLTPIVVTVGEPAGIGPDCILLAWKHRPEAFENACVCTPAAWLAERAALLGMSPGAAPPLVDVDGPEAAPGAIACWNPGVEPGQVAPGQPSPATAPAVIGCIEAAARACMDDRAAAMVTGPIDKSVLRDAGFDFPGHTEFLAHLAGVPRVVMMLASDALRVALVTTHMALRDVPGALDEQGVLETLAITARELERRLGIERPRLALCALNPHGGEAGHFGDEEIRVLAPAARRAREAGLDVTGPLPADSLFAAGRREAFDAIVCCYHDQALIPLKALSFGDAVNITLGLPFVRASVDHGTAPERAGTGEVSYSSLVAALEMARAMRSRQAEKPS